MPVLNIGSINCDHVYHVADFVRPGETLACQRYERHLGGKGLNQSIALQRAGVAVCHVGAIHQDDVWTAQALERTGLPTGAIHRGEAETGHAIIQVSAAGENCILLFPGANACLTPQHIQAALDAHPDHGWVLLQNETNDIAATWAQALAAGRRVAWNPAPCAPGLGALPLEQLGLLVVNEIEAQQLSGADTPPEALARLRARCPDTLVVMTLGADGLHAAQGAQDWRLAAVPTTVVDTTAAGDTITGYLLAGLDAGLAVGAALQRALQAAAITVSREGASPSIPWARELPSA
ncbi:ribokinase [Amphibiibacter pelophylacis]|uniref:Ribokinase n=1 Tax=Amphibiibacter pelophylacis TaxID=1799477 RepID=A0ACC6NY20_9BURK